MAFPWDWGWGHEGEVRAEYRGKDLITGSTGEALLPNLLPDSNLPPQRIDPSKRVSQIPAEGVLSELRLLTEREGWVGDLAGGQPRLKLGFLFLNFLTT